MNSGLLPKFTIDVDLADVSYTPAIVLSISLLISSEAKAATPSTPQNQIPLGSAFTKVGVAYRTDRV